MNINYAKFDIIPDIENVRCLFILESPHTDEIASGLPCMGQTGTRMTNRIFPDSKLPFGQLLATQTIEFSDYGIMNCFSFPLGLKNSNEQIESELFRLKDLVYEENETKRDEFYKEHFNILSQISDLESISGFRSRLQEYIDNAHKLKYLVFCGFISQAMFLNEFNQLGILPFNRPYRLKTKSKRELYALFVNHPSEKNKEWCFQLKSIQ